MQYLKKMKNKVMITILIADKVNLNNRIYPRAVVEKAVSEFNDKYVKSKRAVVYSSLESDLTKAIGLINEIKLDENEVKIDIKWLHPQYEVFNELTNEMCWTPVGLGTLKNVGDGIYEVENYELLHVSGVPKTKELEELKYL